MSEAKHTPGPWEVENVNGCKTIYGNVVREGGDDGGIVTCTDLGFTHGRADESEDAANARVIAAAPDLLAVVNELVRVKRAGVGKDLMEAARAAVQKAEGDA